jgi:hypothetical protein
VIDLLGGKLAFSLEGRERADNDRIERCEHARALLKASGRPFVHAFGR